MLARRPLLAIASAATLASLAALVALAGCAAPTDDGSDPESLGEPLTALAPSPIRVPIAVGALAPALYFYQAGPGQSIKMTPNAGYGCMLEGVSGFFDVASSATITDDGTTYRLVTGASSYARAVCVPWTDFDVAGTPSSTATAPWFVAPAVDASGDTNVAQITIGGSAPACFFAGIGGDWLGGFVASGGNAGRPRLNTASIEPKVTSLWAATNGPRLFARANCYAWPGRAFKQSTVALQTSGSAALPSTSAAVCGISGIGAHLMGQADGVAITQAADGSQTLSATGGATQAAATCIPFAQ